MRSWRSGSWAHPRSRGENKGEFKFRDEFEGSSPLTRGKPPHTSPGDLPGGLIPAHAGKTGPRVPGDQSGRAHPRSRGENNWFISSVVAFWGSSPLTRGKQSDVRRLAARGRLIPAHAGKTIRAGLLINDVEAHPRSRGENAVRMSITMVNSGSSPLTRGKHFLTCAFTAQIDQILETLELAASFGSYLIWVACATDAPQDPVRSIGLVLPSSMGAS